MKLILMRSTILLIVTIRAESWIISIRHSSSCFSRNELHQSDHFVLYDIGKSPSYVRQQQQQQEQPSLLGRKLVSSQQATAQYRKQQSIENGYDALLSLNLNLDALAQIRAPERAQELYQRIIALYYDGYYNVSPDIVSFNSVLKAWQNNPKKALEFWEAEAIPGRMNIISYNTFLLSLARAGMYEAAESLLLQMQANNAPIRPDIVSYNTVLLAYAVAMSDKANYHHHHDDIGHRADALIQQMIDGVRSDIATESTSKNSTTTTTTTITTADTKLPPLPPILDVYYIPPQPNTITYNTIISIWSEYPNHHPIGAGKVEYWLNVMLQQNEHKVRPDVYTYTTVLKALSKCCHPSIPSRVMTILQQMNDDKTVGSTRPNVMTYTTAIQALCNNLKIDMAYTLFNTMLQSTSVLLLPDTVTFTTLFKGWAQYIESCARANDVTNVDRALIAIQQLYIKMKELSQIRPHEVSPDERTYTSILHAYSVSQHVHAGILARHILLEMSNSSITPPQTIHYNAAIACYSKSSSSPNRVIDAAKLWNEMKDLGIPSCTITYNTIIYAAANIYYTTKSIPILQQSYEIGQYVFDTLQNDHNNSPTFMTYRFYFKMLQRSLSSLLLHPTKSSSSSSSVTTNYRISTYQRAFDLCCKQGCLDQIILDRINNSISDDEATILFRSHFESRKKIQNLPSEWSRNNKKT